AVDLAHHRRRGAVQPPRHRTDRLTPGDPVLDLLTFLHAQTGSQTRSSFIYKGRFHPASISKPNPSDPLRHAHGHTGLPWRHPRTDQIPELPTHKRISRRRHHNPSTRGCCNQPLRPPPLRVRRANTRRSRYQAAGGGVRDPATLICLQTGLEWAQVEQESATRSAGRSGLLWSSPTATEE